MSKQRIALVCIALHIAGERRDLQPGEVLPAEIAPDQLADLERLKAFRVEAAETNSSSKDAGTPTGEPGAAGGANAGTHTGGEGTGSEGGASPPPSATGEPPTLTLTARRDVGAPAAALNLNTATAEALQTVGLTPTLAARLIEWRASLGGPIESVDHIVAVSGIGPALLARVRDALTV